MANLNPNSTDYFHSYEPNTNDLTMAMDYNDAGEPVVRTIATVSSTAVGSNKPFYLEVAQGLITGYSFNHRFGAVPSMSSGATGSIWDINDTLYPWDALGTGSIVNVERNNVADNGLTVTIQGLDENYEEVSEDITITGADQTGSQLFTRVNRAFVVDAGGANTGNIDIEAGAAGGTTVARITAGYGQTLMAVYTVPEGYDMLVWKWTIGAGNGKQVEGDISVRLYDSNTWRTRLSFVAYQQPRTLCFSYPIKIPEKSDVEIHGKCDSGTVQLDATWFYLLIPNE